MSGIEPWLDVSVGYRILPSILLLETWKKTLKIEAMSGPMTRYNLLIPQKMSLKTKLQDLEHFLKKLFLKLFLKIEAVSGIYSYIVNWTMVALGIHLFFE